MTISQVNSNKWSSTFQTIPITARFRLWKNAWIYFLAKLLRHPSALLGAVILCLFVLMALLAPYIAPYGPDAGHLGSRFLPPAWFSGGTWSHPLGADELGRDLLSRIIWGSRASLMVGIVTVGISVMIGIALGILSGFYRGWFDSLISRFADLLLAFPFLIFAIGMMAATGPGFGNLVFALTFKGWVEFFRLVRGEVMSEKTKEYVEASRITGQSNLKVMLSEILPNIIHTVIVLATLRMGYMIIMEASLSYLGLGIQDVPAWGSMIKAGKGLHDDGLVDVDIPRVISAGPGSVDQYAGGGLERHSGCQFAHGPIVRLRQSWR